MVILFTTFVTFGQSSGDFRTRQNGDWNNVNTWQRFNGSLWVNATWTPTYNDGTITVQAGYTANITATVQVDQTIIYGAVVVYADPVDLDINDGSGTDLQVFGTIICYGDVDKESAAIIVYESGSKYIHARNGGTIETAIWNLNAECLVTGITSTDPTSTSYNQAFGHFTWNCPSQAILATTSGNLTTINGNFRIKSTGSGSLKISTSATTTLTVGGKFVMTGGIFIVTDGSADNLMIVQGDSLKISGGTLTENGSQIDDAIIWLNKSGIMFYEKTGGIISGSVSFEVLSGCTLDLGTSVLGDPLYSSGYFTLNAGAGLKTQHSLGISTSSSTGCVQMISTKTYSNSANYTFYRNGTQASGNGFQTTQNGLLTIGSTSCATALTLTNSSVLINNELLLISNVSSNSSVSGTVNYGTSATLEYQGASLQPTASGEFPASNGPYHLIISNANGVSLHASRTINGTLYLTSGNFSLGANTLTLNGAITKTSGSISGGISSNLTFGGSGASTNLPAITLNNFTINRANGIALSGSVTTQGTLTLTNGSLIIGANTLTINGLISKTGGSLTGGNSAIIVFGGGGGGTGLPEITLHTLTVNRPNGINLLGNLTIKNQLNLASGALSIGSNTIYLEGIINQNAGSLSGGINSNIQISENASSTVLPSVILNNLTVNRAAGVTMVGDATIYGTLFLTNGNFSISNNTLTFYGSISQTVGGLFGGISSNLVFEENSASGFLPAISLNELTINRSGGIILSGDINANGNLTVQTGTLKATDKILTTAGNININNGGTLWIDGNSQLKISAEKSLNVNSGGMFKATGDPSLPALITQNGVLRGYYGFSVNDNGTIAAQNCVFEYANADGIKINEGALVDADYAFNSCTFQNGEVGGQLLTFNNEEDIVVENAVFPETTTGGQFNVSKNVDVGSVYFYQATGLFAGAAFEYDPYDRINWSGSIVSLDLAIPEGWSGISTNIVPINPDMENLFQPIAQELVILYNLTGFYWPSENINNIGEWDVYSGYVIKVTDDVTLTVNGELVAEKVVSLNAGWNLIPALSQTPASILEAVDGFVVAKGIGTGEILWPAYNIATLEYLNVGKAYYVYTTQPGTITFPENGTYLPRENTILKSLATPWNKVLFTPNTHLVAFNSDNKIFEIGDIVGGFTSNDFCAGVVEITDKTMPFALTLNNDDLTSPEADGFEVGEIISYKLFRPGTGEIFDLDVSYLPEMNAGTFENNGLSVVNRALISVPGISNPESLILKIYPNPTAGIITIQGIENDVTVSVFNAFEKEVFQKRISKPYQINLSNQPKGVYFLKIKTNENLFVEKLILK